MTEPVFPQILRYNLPAKDNVASKGDIDSKYWIILQKTDLERYQQLLEKILAAVHLDINQDVYLVSTDEHKGFPLHTLLEKDTSEHTHTNLWSYIPTAGLKSPLRSLSGEETSGTEDHLRRGPA